MRGKCNLWNTIFFSNLIILAVSSLPILSAEAQINDKLGQIGTIWSSGGELYYSIFYKDKKIGWMKIKIERLPRGGWKVSSSSQTVVSILFSKIKASNRTERFYSGDGQLTKFTLISRVRSRERRVYGRQTDLGIKITLEEKGVKKERFFPKGSFQATSLDRHFPVAPPGITLHRRYLLIQNLEIVDQIAIYRLAAENFLQRGKPTTQRNERKNPRKIGATQRSGIPELSEGQIKYLEVIIKSPRGTGEYLIRRDGIIIAAAMKGKLGKLRLLLERGKVFSRPMSKSGKPTSRKSSH